MLFKVVTYLFVFMLLRGCNGQSTVCHSDMALCDRRITAYEEALLRQQEQITKLEQRLNELVCEHGSTEFGHLKPASQSSTYSDVGSLYASKAVDGNTNSNLPESRSCSHTAKGGTRPWWSVDLEKEVVVKSLKIWNRADCCGERLADFDIFVSSAANPNYSNDKKSCSFFPGEAGLTETIICCPPLKGRYVTIQRRNDGILTLCEVKVYIN